MSQGDFLCRVGFMGCRGGLPGEVFPVPGSCLMSQGDFLCRDGLMGCRSGLPGKVVSGPRNDLKKFMINIFFLANKESQGDFLCRVGLMGCRGGLPGEVVPVLGSRTMSQGDFLCWVGLMGWKGHKLKCSICSFLRKTCFKLLF